MSRTTPVASAIRRLHAAGVLCLALAVSAGRAAAEPPIDEAGVSPGARPQETAMAWCPDFSSCGLTISPTTVAVGGSIQLSWFDPVFYCEGTWCNRSDHFELIIGVDGSWTWAETNIPNTTVSMSRTLLPAAAGKTLTYVLRAVTNSWLGTYVDSNWVNVTVLPSGGTGACVADATTLCISDRSGDQRFRVRVAYQTAQGGGAAGNGRAISLASAGVARGGLFWFFGADNPEMLVKVLNGCAVNGRYWFFSSAGTNVGLTTTVTDTQRASTRTYTSPDLQAAVPVQDVTAFPCN